MSTLPDLPPVQHAGERVLTTELLARAYGVEEKALQDNYQANRERFAEGLHFYKLTGPALRVFKDEPGNSGLVGAKASHLTLWTERGASRHAKVHAAADDYIDRLFDFIGDAAPGAAA